jgi:hypothetical protein
MRYYSHTTGGPGTQVARVMATAGVDIDTVSITTKGYVVFGVDDLPGAIHVAAGMAVMIDE